MPLFMGCIWFWGIELDVGVHVGLLAEPHWDVGGGSENSCDSVIYHACMIGYTYI